MTINCERLEEINFSSVYYMAGQRVLVSKESEARGLADLGGKRVCAAKESTSLRNIAAAPSGPVPVSVCCCRPAVVLPVGRGPQNCRSGKICSAVEEYEDSCSAR
jgi:hypothetical protein